MASRFCALGEGVSLRWVLRLIACFLISSFNLVAGQTCSPEPIQLPVKDVKLQNDASIRGIAMSVGDPPQELSFQPVIKLDNVWIYDSDHNECPHLTVDACSSLHGGLYDTDNSSSLEEFKTAEAAGTTHDDSYWIKTAGWATDDVTLDSNTTWKGLPLAFSRAQSVMNRATNSIGVGVHSTLLSALKKAGKIGSQTWSLWWGQAGLEHSTRMDGSFVMGGYDAAKIVDPERNHSAALDALEGGTTGVGLTISGLFLNFPNGTTPNLLDPNLGSSPIPAVVCPQWPVVMSLPYDPYVKRFTEWTGGTPKGRSYGYNFFSLMFDVDDVYQGDLTVVFDSGFSVRIPNSQLVVPETTIGKDGKLDYDPDTQNVLFYSLEGVNRNDLVCIGQYFFTSAYLMVNQDENQFTIWEAKATDETNLVSVSNTDEDDKEACHSTEVTGPSETNDPEDPKSKSQHGDSRSIAIGAIVGIVIGVFALFFSLGVLSWLWRRRQRRQQPRGPPTPAQQFISEKQAWSGRLVDSESGISGFVNPRPPELPAGPRPVHFEADSASQLPHELECPPAELGKGRRSEVLGNPRSQW